MDAMTHESTTGEAAAVPGRLPGTCGATSGRLQAAVVFEVAFKAAVVLLGALGRAGSWGR